MNESDVQELASAVELGIRAAIPELGEMLRSLIVFVMDEKVGQALDGLARIGERDE